MSKMMNKKHLACICSERQLGSLKEVATRVYGSRGGSLMWRIHTEKGSFAIKQLSPIIDLKNEKIVSKYELSETIAYRFSQQGIPAVSAIEKRGKHLIIIENIGYLVYPWVEGYTLGHNEISENHALKVAAMIAKLHSLNMYVPEIGPPRFDIYSSDNIVEAINQAESSQCPFAKTLKENQSLILSANDSYLAVIPLLKEGTVVTHGDLDRLNILWDKTDQPILIDWESAKKLNPTREIVRASLGWSGMGTEDSSLPIYVHMLQTYTKSGGMLNRNHMNAALHAIFGSIVYWMLYNIELACTSHIPAERDTAIDEVNQILPSIKRLKKLIPDLLKVNLSRSG